MRGRWRGMHAYGRALCEPTRTAAPRCGWRWDAWTQNRTRDAIMNDLEQHFTKNTGRLIHKYRHYFEIYDRHFSRFRGTDVHVVEFGVSHGGSLQMWKRYFGPQAHIFGIDINPQCKKLEEEQIQIFIGDQDDRRFLQSLAEKIPRMDILI